MYDESQRCSDGSSFFFFFFTLCMISITEDSSVLVRSWFKPDFVTQELCKKTRYKTYLVINEQSNKVQMVG